MGKRLVDFLGLTGMELLPAEVLRGVDFIG